MLTLPVGRTIANRYQLERKIGKGGMGFVYRATDTILRRDVAIKIINADCFGDRLALRRFDKEARAAARLSHPNIIKVFDYGRTEIGGAWLVMELVEGITMREELNRQRRLAPATIVKWFDQLTDGVAAAHRSGIIHRDLKPENVLIDQSHGEQTQIKILDFGLAKLNLPETSLTGGSTITRPGMLIGTPGYMSPEQLMGEGVSERSDVFAIGIMLVEALTGNRPFKGKTVTEHLQAIQSRSYGLPNDNMLSQIAQKCLAPDPRDRYQTVLELRQELLLSISSQ
jgi:serine/threonine protein kinase